MIQDKKTEELNEILVKTSPGELKGYLKENKEFLANDKRAFYDYFTDVLKEKRIKLKDVYSFADVGDSYGGQIIRQEKKTADRDLIIRFCLAGHFTFVETNRALKLYGMRELYAKEPRDACLIVAVNNRIYDLSRIDDMLEEQGQKKISSEIGQ